MRKSLALLAAPLLAMPLVAAAPIWTEEATRELRDPATGAKWGNPLGDWIDAAGAPMGARPFATATLRNGATATTADLDVTDLVRRYGADFRLHSVDGFVAIDTREAPGGGPTLTITRGGAAQTLKAAADTNLDISTERPLGHLPVMTTRYAALVRFDQPADPAITRAVLRLPIKRVWYGDARILVFRPAALTETHPAAPGAVYAVKPPRQFRMAPRFEAQIAHGAAAEPRAATRTLFQTDGAGIKLWPGASRHNGPVYEGWIEGVRLSASTDVIALPMPAEEAYLTVVLKLAPDWRAPGGKLPGLANTGQKGASCAGPGGGALPSGGWGGRPANACHWSARTFYGTSEDGVLHGGTYFYALKPKDVNGVVDPWSLPIPKGRWFAYVEHVKLNHAGADDGEIGYWLVDRQSAPGGKRVEAARGIQFRDSAAPASAINEVWADVYCGGRDCGPAPWPRSTIFIRRLAMTDGLPDLAAIEAEVDRLNAGGA